MAKWNLDDPELADEWAKIADEQNASLGDALDPAARLQLLKMIKHNEFTLEESAILKCLLGEPMTFDELGVFLGACSKRTGGKPMSKIAARKEVLRIQKVLAKRAKIKYGYNIDLSKFDAVKRDMKKAAADKKKEIRRGAAQRKKNREEVLSQIMKQQQELRQLRKDKGIKQPRVAPIKKGL